VRWCISTISFVFLAMSLGGVSAAREAQRAASTNSPSQTRAEAVFAGGCFWGVESVFEHVKGVTSVTSIYARYTSSPAHEAVEAVRIEYSPAHVSYRQLLEVLFLVAHDPTSRDRQGPDAGPEYRAAVLYQTPVERNLADAYIAELTAAHRFARPMVTEVRALAGFTVAEPDHQNYASRHPKDPYIVQNDAPKLVRLQQIFQPLYQAERAP
jgi:peptide-methionine (S)-S-oxide reductase